MKNATMLYKLGNEYQIEGIGYDTIIVDECDIDKAKKNGWNLTTTEAKILKDISHKATRKHKTENEDELH